MSEVGIIKPASAPAIGSEVYDRRTKQAIVCTLERRMLLDQLTTRVRQANFDTAASLYLIHEGSLYTERGYDHFNEFIAGEDGIGLGLRQAYYYVKIGEHIQAILSEAREQGQDQGDVMLRLSAVKITSWRELSNLAKEDVLRLGLGDEYIAPDGSVVTLKQIAEMGSKEIREQISKLRERSLTAEEKQKQLQAEVDTLRAQIGDDPTATGELVLKLNTLQGEIDALRGASRKREQAAAEVNEATRKIDEALVVLRKYEPMKAADFEDAVLAEVMAEVAGRCASFANKLGDIAGRYDREHGKWSGERA